MTAAPRRGPRSGALFFDVGNTLIRPARPVLDVYAEVFNRFGADVDAASLNPIFRRVWAELDHEVQPGADRYRRFDGGERGWWSHFVHRIVEEAGLDIDWQASFEVLFDRFRHPGAWHIYDDVFPALPRLREAGWRLGIISNWDRRLGQLLSDLALAGEFETIVISAEEGCEKPDPRIFRLAADRLGVRPEACVHVGDSVYFDAEGALGAGMDAVLIRRSDAVSHTDFPRDGSETPAPVIGDLEALPGVLGEAR